MAPNQVEFRLERGSPTFDVLGGPIPALKVKLISRVRGVAVGAGAATLLHIGVRASVQGIPITDAYVENQRPFSDQLGFLDSHEMLLMLRLPRYLLDAVESQRTDNVQIDVSVEIGFWNGSSSSPNDPFGWASAYYMEKIPQSEWLGLLEKLGLGAAFLIEFRTPRIVGLDDAVRHLESARKHLAEHDPASSVSDCRKAWDRLDVAIQPYEAKLTSAIDGLSVGEKNQPTKAQRVAEIRKSIDKLAQIGPHSDLYDVAQEDALLVYRMTVCAASYLASQLSRIQRGTPPPTVPNP
jgi:hypothetical protein